jgi:hypothetical protein
VLLSLSREGERVNLSFERHDPSLVLGQDLAVVVHGVVRDGDDRMTGFQIGQAFLDFIESTETQEFRRQ